MSQTKFNFQMNQNQVKKCVARTSYGLSNIFYTYSYTGAAKIYMNKLYDHCAISKPIDYFKLTKIHCVYKILEKRKVNFLNVFDICICLRVYCIHRLSKRKKKNNKFPFKVLKLKFLNRSCILFYLFSAKPFQ